MRCFEDLRNPAARDHAPASVAGHYRVPEWALICPLFNEAHLGLSASGNRLWVIRGQRWRRRSGRWWGFMCNDIAAWDDIADRMSLDRLVYFSCVFITNIAKSYAPRSLDVFKYAGRETVKMRVVYHP